MTNEEIIDEILHEASELKIREQVLDLSRKLREQNLQIEHSLNILPRVTMYSKLSYIPRFTTYNVNIYKNYKLCIYVTDVTDVNDCPTII